MLITPCHDGQPQTGDSYRTRYLLDEIEAALAECLPVVSDDAAWRALYQSLGWRGLSVEGFDALCVDDVVTISPGRFEFARSLERPPRWRRAIIVPCRDEWGDLADLGAWDPDSGDLALWRGHVALLGAEQIFAPRIGYETLPVHASVLAWLRAGREGAYPIDLERAAPLLRQAAPLEASDTDFGAWLQAALTQRPAVYVRRAQSARTAT